MKKEEVLEQLKEELLEMAHLKSAIAVLAWDQEVFMPEKGIETRSHTIANLTGILHEKFMAKKFQSLLLKGREFSESGQLEADDDCIVREIWREFEREKKMPIEFVKELSRVCSKGQSVWAQARAKADFSLFAPYLQKIVELKRQEADFAGFEENPYDALLDVYEPYMSTRSIAVTFEELKNFLVPFLKKIQDSSVKTDPEILKGQFPLAKQIEFNKLVAEKIGFDFSAGRLDVSTHPFSTNFSPEDVRITTRFKQENILYSLMSTIHEAGHALYEQGILVENFGTPLGESISLGIHESQSRVWENIVGRGKPFWEHFYPQLQKTFPKPFQELPLEKFYQAINHVSPSLIRTEADEVTYNLHIIMRFEIEKELLDGSIEVRDLPKIWNAKVKEYFDLEVPNDALGVLQDVHWSGGNIGYFPTYALGNLYAAQFYATAQKNIDQLEEKFQKGQFGQFREWLKENIHIHGKLYCAEELAKKVTGEPLNSQHFTNYLQKKYSAIYQLN